MTDEIDPDLDELQPRAGRQVAERCLGLMAVVGRSLGAPLDDTNKWVAKHDLAPFLTLAENAYLQDERPSHQVVVDFSWKSEALAALLWALGGLSSLKPLNVQVDLSQIALFEIATKDPQAFLASSSLRSAEVLAEAEADLYHQHWRVRDAQLFSKPMPPELHPGIVYERRYALSWVVGWGTSWDDVPTDT
jgi:Domain of unknown function (DUF4272)